MQKKTVKCKEIFITGGFNGLATTLSPEGVKGWYI